MEQLTSRRVPWLIAGIGIALGLATIAIVAWVLFGPSTDRPPTAAEKRALADGVCPQTKASHFYRIEKAGKASYLLGERHAGIGLAKYPPAVADAFRVASVAVFESDLSAHEPPPVGENVEQLLGPELWDKYRDLVGDATAARVKHSVERAVAELAFLYEDPSQSIDIELQKLARMSAKRVVALEDGAASAHLSETYLGIGMLRTSLRQIANRKVLENVTRRTLRQYCTGERSASGSLDDITNERTRTWIDKLVPLLEQGGVFIAVGSAHVDDGSLDLGRLLESQGFTVTAVSR